MANIYSWQVTVSSAGTAVQGPDTGPGVFQINADPENTGYIYIGNDGADDVASSASTNKRNNCEWSFREYF